MYRVCLEQGCFNSDSVRAVNQAILDGVDVINFSIGGGANPYTDPVDLAFLDAFNAGINVNASAGNSGPGAATAAHGGPWETTVGASTWNGAFTTTLHLKSSDGSTLDKPGVTITGGISSATPVVLSQSIPGEDALCQTPLVAGTAVGKIVACQRGVNARVDKGFNVAQGGAAGMILYNPISQDVETDNHWLPAIHVDGPNADLTTFISTKPGVTATWTTGIESPAKGNVMATFSSRGPVGDFIKPDITAPGIQILAGMTPQPIGTVNGPPGQFFQAIAGTSMSSPHSAGASALVRAFHPDWTPAEVKSALMTSASQDVVKEDGVTDFDPFDAGAGGLDVLAAIDPTLVFNETTANFLASVTDPLHRIDLNLASIDATTMTGEVTTQRTARNVSNKNQTLDIKITQPAGVTITVGDKNKALKINKNTSLTFPITISAPAVANGQYFARIYLIPRNGDKSVTIPVAFVRKQGAVSMTHTCAPTTFLVNTGLSHCSVSLSNLGSLAANVNLTVGNGDSNGKLVYKNASAPATVTGNQVKFAGSLVPALPPQVTSITAGGSPAGGYLPLSLFGIAPIAGVGDDTITNFNTPTFMYGGEPYTRLGVVSNGYLVLGGGTAADIVFTPQTFPNAARPNNVVAPFWSDLNPAAAGAIRIGTLTDGVSTWIVVDWAGVRNFSNVTTHSFQVWLRISPGAEQVTMTYGNPGAGAGDPASGTNFGAENRDGSSGKNLAANPGNNTDFTINLTPPQAGGTQTVTYDVSATRDGIFSSLAGLTSNVTPGITQVPVELTVTK